MMDSKVIIILFLLENIKASKYCENRPYITYEKKVKNSYNGINLNNIFSYIIIKNIDENFFV